MGWEMVKKKEVPHVCDVQGALRSDQVSEGDIIRCTECMQNWEVYMTDGGVQWDPYPRVLALKRQKPQFGR